MRLRPALGLAAAFAAGAASCVDVEQRYVAPRVGDARVLEGDGQVAQIGSNVPIAPAILVLGRDSLPMKNIEVRFSVRDSGSAVSGAIQRTDSVGVARVLGWRVRATPGIDTLLAVVVGVKTIVLTATVTPPCASTGTLAHGDSVMGTIADGDCQYAGGRRAVAYGLTGTAAKGARFTITGSGYTGRMVLERGGIPQATTISDTGAVSTMLVFFGARSYNLLATGANGADRGAFTMRASPLTTVLGCSKRLYITRGVITSQFLDTDACVYRDSNLSPYFAHEFRIRLAKDERIVVRMNGATIGPFILILDEAATVVLSQNNTGTNTAVAIAFTARVSGFYTIAALAGANPNTIGPYDIAVDP